MSESSVVDCLGGFGQDFSVGCRSVLYSQNDKRFCRTTADDDDTVSSWFEVRNADHHALVISVGVVVAEIHPCGTPFSVNRKSLRFCLGFKTVGYYYFHMMLCWNSFTEPSVRVLSFVSLINSALISTSSPLNSLIFYDKVFMSMKKNLIGKSVLVRGSYTIRVSFLC